MKVSIDTLRENPENPRSISGEKFEKLVNSIRQFPEMMEARPIVVDQNNVILGGNMRFKAAKEAGLQEVDVYVASWDEAKNPEFIIKDNVGFGEWDWDMLANEWDAVLLDDWGLDVWQEEEEKEGLTDPDEVPEVPADPVTQLGDLWILGEHRLLCGDSTKAEDVERLMDGQKADMVFTDPPYGMHLDADYKTNNGAGLYKGKDMNRASGVTHRNVAGDHDDFTPDLINTVFASFNYCNEIFLWGADYYAEHIPSRKEGSWVVWDKVTKADGERSGVENFHGSNFELCWSKAKHKRELARIMHKGLASVENDKRVHPTQKPVALAEWFLERWGKDKTVVADLYGGSGSTLIACEKTSRYCCMMELDPAYCDVIVKRWEDFTGQKASKANA